MSTTLAGRVPISTLDPYTDQALLNLWPLYRELREMGPIVWLEKCGMFALTRYDVVVSALRGHAVLTFAATGLSTGMECPTLDDD
jgi:hypothetical protein